MWFKCFAVKINSIIYVFAHSFKDFLFQGVIFTQIKSKTLMQVIQNIVDLALEENIYNWFYI